MAKDHRAELKSIRTFPQLVRFLRDEMGWPIEAYSFEELTFDFSAEELGIDPNIAAKIQDIKRLRPLSPNQPWGIFFVKFEPKRLPVVALRRILSQVVLKKRATARVAEQATWALNDLLFVSNYGEGDDRRICLAHFTEDNEVGNLAVLEVLGWDGEDTGLHLDDVAEKLTENLAWPKNEDDADEWREKWRSAFELRHREVITTSKALAIRLADLARSIRTRVKAALAVETERGKLRRLLKAFQESLIHDLDEDAFADMYAQTIAYGLLSARVSRRSGALVADDVSSIITPVTSPFLRELLETFLNLGGRKRGADGGSLDFDELGINEVVETLRDANMEAVLRDFGDKNPQEDPVIHFYQDFLKEYNAKMRMQRGVFYTPRPVVTYIVRSVDELLRTEFGLEDGLADITTWGEMARRHEDLKIPDGMSPDRGFVQILDPACGTGTFLVEVIDVIYRTMSAKWKVQGHGVKETSTLWNEYVPKHLLPRLHGYELLMAPYAIAHLKFGLKLYETGYRFGSDERVAIYLTNALEPAGDDQLRLDFLPALAHEAHAVSEVKRWRRFTVVIGNPPYAQYSMNMSQAAKTHIERFRYANGQRIRARNALQFERNLNDDYVKFLGFSALLFPPNTGVLGMITNRMYLESESLTGLREWLATNFERAYVLDLWGSGEEARRVTRLTDDENVFDILQGVAVSLFVRRVSSSRSLAIVAAREAVGKRDDKYRLLAEDLELAKQGWHEMRPQAKWWWLHRAPDKWDSSSGFSLGEIFPAFSTLVASNRDHLVIGMDQATVVENVRDVGAFRGTNEELGRRFSITLKKGWNLTAARRQLQEIDNPREYIQSIEYRPFDRRWIFFHPTLVWQSAPVVSGNVLGRAPNLVLISLGKNRAETLNGQWVSERLADKSVVSTRDNASGFPLYLYTSRGLLGTGDDAPSPNLSPEFLKELASRLGVTQCAPYGLPGGVTPEYVFDYVYALLYSPRYRERYAESLKVGFPRIPLPGSRDLFGQVSRLGGELVSLHLLDTPDLDEFITTYTGPMNPEVGRVGWSNGTVWVDALATKKAQPAVPGTSGFRGVPEDVWDLHIGGYQVCEKWLKDRKGRTLSKDDIIHYQRIVVALNETIRLMKEIDEVIEGHGGWPGAFAAGGEASVVG